MRTDIESIGIDPVRLRLVLMNIVKIFGLVFIGIATSAPPRSFAAEQGSDVPTWLNRALCQASLCNLWGLSAGWDGQIFRN